MNANNVSFIVQVTQITTRLVCIGALAWLGVIIAGNATAIKRGPTGDARTPRPLGHEFPDLMTTAAGYWSFADSQFSVQRARCANAEINQRLQSTLSMDIANIDSASDASRLVDVAKASGAVRSDFATGSLWMVDNDEVRLRLMTSAADNSNDKPLLVAAVFAVRDGGDWELTTIKPREDAGDHLMPLPRGFETICTRRDDSGRLQMELIETSHPAEAILDVWRGAGWELQRTPWSAAGSFSYLCTRGGKAIYAWSVAESGHRTLLLSSAADASVETSIATTNQTSNAMPSISNRLAKMAMNNQENKR